MHRVLPEVEPPCAAPADQGDVVGSIEDRRKGVAISRKASVAEAPNGRRILRLDPSESALAVNLFEPEIRIVVGRF